MRLKRARSTRLLVTLAAALAAAVFGVLVGADRAPERPSTGQDGPSPRQEVSLAPEVAKLPWVKPGTRKVVGKVEARGRTLRLETAVSTDGEECLLDTDVGTGSTGATCSKDGLFSARKVAFSVNFNGGPERFSALSVVGLAAPGIAAVALAKSDGSLDRFELDRTRAFVLDSSPSELERGVVPTGLLLFGPSGKRVEEIAIPAPR